MEQKMLNGSVTKKGSRANVLSAFALIASGLASGAGAYVATGSALAAIPPTKTFILKNWGLNNSKTKSHISAVDAWKLQEGSHSVVVAVIDTGIDPRHRDLKANLWTDNNQDTGARVYGWNFVANTPNPGDDHGHGTHVAGIIGATTDPNSGVSGVAHKVSIMPVKYYSDQASGAVNLANSVKAIHWAVNHGAKIINYSGGGREFSEEEYLAIKKAEAHGVLVVAAAGNEACDTDKQENFYYPASYRLSNIVVVGATNIENRLLDSSNWGHNRVDIAAPGENIWSTIPGGGAGFMTGTSQATAFVTGVAALLLSENPKLTPSEIRSILVSTADPIAYLKGRVRANGHVNAYKALLQARQLRHGRQAPRELITQSPMQMLRSLGPSRSTADADSTGSY